MRTSDQAKLSGSNLFTRLNYWIVTLGGQVLVTPPEINSVEAPSSASIVCQGDTFTFKLDQAPADNGGIFLVIEATEGKSNGVSRAYASAAAIKLVEEPTAAAAAAGMQSGCAFLNTEGGWLFFGIHPQKLTLLGQDVADQTRQDIANAFRKFSPAIDLSAQYIDVPGKPGKFGLTAKRGWNF